MKIFFKSLIIAAFLLSTMQMHGVEIAPTTPVASQEITPNIQLINNALLSANVNEKIRALYTLMQQAIGKTFDADTHSAFATALVRVYNEAQTTNVYVKQLFEAALDTPLLNDAQQDYIQNNMITKMPESAQKLPELSHPSIVAPTFQPQTIQELPVSVGGGVIIQQPQQPVAMVPAQAAPAIQPAQPIQQQVVAPQQVILQPGVPATIPAEAPVQVQQPAAPIIHGVATPAYLPQPVNVPQTQVPQVNYVQQPVVTQQPAPSPAPQAIIAGAPQVTYAPQTLPATQVGYGAPVRYAPVSYVPATITVPQAPAVQVVPTTTIMPTVPTTPEKKDQKDTKKKKKKKDLKKKKKKKMKEQDTKKSAQKKKKKKLKKATPEKEVKAESTKAPETTEEQAAQIPMA